MHRGWQDNPAFHGDAFSRRDAWVWIIENAAFRSTKISSKKGYIQIERGQLCFSLRFMAQAWKWDDSRVRRLLRSLSSLKMIDSVADASHTIITICNYDQYQNINCVADADIGASATQDRRRTDAKKKEDNKLKQDLSLVANAPSDSDKTREPSGNKASRLPPNWETPESDIDWARAEGYSLEIIRLEGEKFRDYWHAKGGKDATKLDWHATWRNWLRNSKQPKLTLIGDLDGKTSKSVSHGSLDGVGTDHRPISPLYAALEDFVG